MRKLIIILLLLPLAGCNDWLDVESQKSVTLTGFFKSESEVESWVFGIFNAEKAIDSWPTIPQLGYTGLYCDDAGAYESYRRLEPNFCMDPNNRQDWAYDYQVIYLANSLINARDRFENVTEERADFWIAQANFAKAYAYFDLARQWGEAPIVNTTETAPPVGKSTVEEVLQEALRCAQAALILPVHGELKDSYGAKVTSKNYANLGTVQTLLANIYAWMGGLYGGTEYWQKAETAASAVIDDMSAIYDLEPTIADMLEKSMGKTRNSKETIFDMEINEIDVDRLWFSSLERRYPGMALIDYPYMSTDPKRIESNTQSPRITTAKVKELFSDPGDVRLKEYWYQLDSVKYETSGGATVYSTYAFMNKWREGIRQTNPEIQEDYSGLVAMEGNRVVWRLPDLILLRAECRARLQKLGEARSDLNRVRKRAGLTEYTGSEPEVVDAEALRKEIFLERSRELFGEGQRYYDIVRNGYYADELPGNFKTLTQSDVDNGALYLPVHDNAFRKNVYMEQNTYWLWQQ